MADKVKYPGFVRKQRFSLPKIWFIFMVENFILSSNSLCRTEVKYLQNTLRFV